MRNPLFPHSGWLGCIVALFVLISAPVPHLAAERDPATGDANAEWSRWLPDPDTVTIRTVTREGRTRAHVTVMAPSSNHHIRDWGRPGLRVDAKSIVYHGPGLPVVTPREHTYDLGHLRPGDYRFTFACWGKDIKTHRFHVPRPPDDDGEPAWSRWLPRRDAVTIRVETRDGHARAHVTVMAPSSNHKVRDWGRPGLEVDAKTVLLHGPGLPVLTPREHTYDLGQFRPGDYRFVFRCWGQTVQVQEFTIPGPEPSPGPRPEPSPGDLTRNGCVGMEDFIHVLENWGLVDKDTGETIGHSHLMDVLTHWGSGC